MITEFWKKGTSWDYNSTVEIVERDSGRRVLTVKSFVKSNAPVDLVIVAPQMLDALRAAEEALEEGFVNCGGDFEEVGNGADCVYAEPLKKVRAVLEALKGIKVIE